MAAIRPWATEDHGDWIDIHTVSETLLVAEVQTEDIGRKTGRANARFIVRACNVHDDLLNACKDCLHLADLYVNQPHLDGLVAHAFAEMQHLLRPLVTEATKG